MHLRSLNEFATIHNANLRAELAKSATLEDVERNTAKLHDTLNSVAQRELMELLQSAKAAEADTEAEDSEAPENSRLSWENGKWVYV
jgi:hypothetical protein